MESSHLLPLHFLLTVFFLFAVTKTEIQNRNDRNYTGIGCKSSVDGSLEGSGDCCMCLKVDVYLTPGAGGVNALDQDKFPTRYDLDHKAKRATKGGRQI